MLNASIMHYHLASLIGESSERFGTKSKLEDFKSLVIFTKLSLQIHGKLFFS